MPSDGKSQFHNLELFAEVIDQDFRRPGGARTSYDIDTVDLHLGVRYAQRRIAGLEEGHAKALGKLARIREIIEGIEPGDHALIIEKDIDRIRKVLDE
jgi:hypothetical protein